MAPRCPGDRLGGAVPARCRPGRGKFPVGGRARRGTGRCRSVRAEAGLRAGGGGGRGAAAPRGRCAVPALPPPAAGGAAPRRRLSAVRAPDGLLRQDGF